MLYKRKELFFLPKFNCKYGWFNIPKCIYKVKNDSYFRSVLVDDLVLNYVNRRFWWKGPRKSFFRSYIFYNVWKPYRVYPEHWEIWSFYKPICPDQEFFIRYKRFSNNSYNRVFRAPEFEFLITYNIENEYRWPLPERNFFSAPRMQWYSKPDFKRRIWRTVKLC